MIFKNQLNIKYWIVLDIFIVTILIIELVLGLISISKDIIDHQYYLKYIEEVLESPIMSIQVKKDSEECELDTQLLVFDIWPGLIEGCECLHKNRIYSSKCTNGLLEEGCVKKQKIPPKPITKWRNKEFCVKYSSRLDFTGNGFREHNCGIIYERNKKDYLYANSYGQCPINDIIINNEPHHYTNHGILYVSIQLTSPSESSPLYLHWTNKAIYNYLISSFKIEDGKICSDPFLKDLNSPYIFDPYYFASTCNNNFNRHIPVYSTKYELIDYIEKGELFSDNGISIPSHDNYNVEDHTFLYIKKINNTLYYPRDINYSRFKNDKIDERLVWQFHIVGVTLTLLMQLLLIGYKVVYKYHITICYNWFEMAMMFCHVFNFIVAMLSMLNSERPFSIWEDNYRISNEVNLNENEIRTYSIINMALSLICSLIYPSDILVNCLFGYRKEMLEYQERILKEKKKTD